MVFSLCISLDRTRTAQQHPSKKEKKYSLAFLCFQAVVGPNELYDSRQYVNIISQMSSG